MTDNENFIIEFYQQNYSDLSKPPINHFQHINLNKLPQENRILSVEIEIQISDTLYVKDTIEWNLEDQNKSPFKFAEILINNLKNEIEPHLIEKNFNTIPNQIRDQIVFHCEQYVFQRKYNKTNEEINSNFCSNCNSIKFNQDFCILCFYDFRNKIILSSEQIEFEKIQTNLYSTSRKTCLSCKEVNSIFNNCCSKCNEKFDLREFLQIKVNELFSINFYEKITKHLVISQLTKFDDKFIPEDFLNLKYLYNKILIVLEENYKKVLTKEAYYETISYISKMYLLYVKPSLTVEKIIDKCYFNKFAKSRPKLNQNGQPFLNYNELKDWNYGFLPENYYKNLVLKCQAPKNLFKSFKTIKSSNKEEEEEEETDSKDQNIPRRRGRPRKLDIFEQEQQEKGISKKDRESLFNNTFNPPPTLNYDFCGKCLLPKHKDFNLLKCESCSSSYHFTCLNYEKIPKGRFKCYYCKIQKLGIENSAFVDLDQIKQIKRLSKPLKNLENKIIWNIKCGQLIEVLMSHPCSFFFKDKVPEELVDYFEEFNENIYFDFISEKVKSNSYDTPQDFVNELYKIFYNNMSYFNVSSFMYGQIRTLYDFCNFFLIQEKILKDLVTIGKKVDSGEKNEDDFILKELKNEEDNERDIEIKLKDDLKFETNIKVEEKTVKNVESDLLNFLTPEMIEEIEASDVEERRLTRAMKNGPKKRGRKKGVKLKHKSLYTHHDLGGVNDEEDDRYIGRRTRSKYVNKYTSKDVEDDEENYNFDDVESDLDEQ